MSETAARERHLIRKRATQMQRAVAAIELAIDALSPIDQLIVLNSVLREALATRRPPPAYGRDAQPIALDR